MADHVDESIACFPVLDDATLRKTLLLVKLAAVAGWSG
jgi:hypothetical protein